MLVVIMIVGLRPMWSPIHPKIKAPSGLKAKLEFMLANNFERITYTEAVELLKKSGVNFTYPVEYGLNLQSEHERWLTEEHFKKPVTVFNYPKEIKPFYMRINDDGKTVAAMDLLVPGIGAA